MRRPSKRDALRAVLEIGAPVRTVIDVGVQYKTEELAEILPDRHHVLCEPVEEFHQSIAEYYTSMGIAYTLVDSAISDTDGKGLLKLTGECNGPAITHARFAEAEDGDPGLREVPTLRLDTLVDQENLAAPFLLKIDVDGAEAAVLSGAEGMLKHCSAVIVETQMWNLFERARPLIDAGFALFDIADLCFYDRFLAQVDLIFVNPEWLPGRSLDIYRSGYDFSHWNEFSKHLDALDASSHGGS